MKKINRDEFPLFSRLSAALYQGIFRTVTSEEQLPPMLLEFFRGSEVKSLLVELQKIADKDMNDAEWEEYWYSSTAASFPQDAKSSHRLIELLIKEITNKKFENDER
jgi:hypothetical protein